MPAPPGPTSRVMVCRQERDANTNDAFCRNQGLTPFMTRNHALRLVFDHAALLQSIQKLPSHSIAIRVHEQVVSVAFLTHYSVGS